MFNALLSEDEQLNHSYRKNKISGINKTLIHPSKPILNIILCTISCLHRPWTFFPISVLLLTVVHAVIIVCIIISITFIFNIFYFGGKL